VKDVDHVQAQATLFSSHSITLSLYKHPKTKTPFKDASPAELKITFLITHSNKPRSNHKGHSHDRHFRNLETGLYSGKEAAGTATRQYQRHTKAGNPYSLDN